ncbi:MAG: hypothetical protein PVH21_03590 [Myxococcales bacterium]|jgi:hypothetical protein
MKHAIWLVGALLVLQSRAFAQEEVSTGAESGQASGAEPASTPPSDPPKEEDKRGPYYRKVQGWLWLEAFAGPSGYDPDAHGSLNIGGSPANAPKVKGPEYGFSVGTPFGGAFFLGWFYRRANYDGYGLMKTGVEFQPTIRIPYVHVMFRVDLGYAKMVSGNPYGLTSLDNGGIVATGGVGLRIPIVRWISFVGSVDWSYIGIALKGDSSTGSVNSWISGRQVTGTFGLTFQFIGVRKN